jgi:curved DNA-binding protein
MFAGSAGAAVLLLAVLEQLLYFKRTQREALHVRPQGITHPRTLAEHTHSAKRTRSPILRHAVTPIHTSSPLLPFLTFSREACIMDYINGTLFIWEISGYCMEYKDYYKVLGVERKANEKAIKKAYRKLARKYHPDVNQDNKKTAEKFHEINEANEVLSDPEKRREYDQLGADWQKYRNTGGRPDDFKWDGRQGSSGRAYEYKSMRPEDYEEMFGGQGGYSDFFENLFGRAAQGKAGGKQGQAQYHYKPRPRRGVNLEHTVQASLAEAFHGTNRVLEWEDGRKIDAKIPPGVKSGSRVRLKGQGTPGMHGGTAGDLYLTIEVIPDDKFKRDNSDLLTTVKVDLFTMLLGGKVSVSGLDRTVSLTIPSGTANGKVFRLRGLGMPELKRSDKRGDLYVTVETVLPKKLSEKEKELVEQWKASSDKDSIKGEEQK